MSVTIAGFHAGSIPARFSVDYCWALRGSIPRRLLTLKTEDSK